MSLTNSWYEEDTPTVYTSVVHYKETVRRPDVYNIEFGEKLDCDYFLDKFDFDLYPFDVGFINNQVANLKEDEVLVVTVRGQY